MNQKIVFLSNFMKNPGQVAAVAPSSKYVIKAVLENIDFGKAKNIVEYGPGTGPVTKALLEQMEEDSSLICIEPNANFYSFLGKSINDPRLKLINDVAENIDFHLNKLAVRNVDYILSGIPFSLVKKEAKISILRKTLDALGKNGKFIVYQQYNWHMEKHLKKYFSNVSKQMEFRNLPPTFIFVCKKNKNTNHASSRAL